MARPEVTGKKPCADADAIAPAFLPISVCGEYLGLSEATIYRLLGLGKLQAVKAGSRTLVTMQSAQEYAASLPPAKIKPPPNSKMKLGARPTA